LITPDIAYQALRFLHDTSLMLVWGCCAFLCLLMPPLLAGQIWPRLARLLLPSVAIAALTTAPALPLQAAIIGNGWADAADLSTIHSILFETTIGTAWMAQAASGLLLCFALILPQRMRMTGLMYASGIGLICLTFSGHAAMHEGWLGLAHRVNDAVHVLAAGGWLGALMPLLPVLRALAGDESRKDATTALIRFSNVGHVVVAVVLLSGVLNTALVLRRLPTDWSSPYQTLLALKIAVVGSMVIVATINRYVFVPWMRRSQAAAIDAIRMGSIVEILLGVAAIACVGVFGMLEPV
jgi:putative copper resistance protein D